MIVLALLGDCGEVLALSGDCYGVVAWKGRRNVGEKDISCLFFRLYRVIKYM